MSATKTGTTILASQALVHSTSVTSTTVDTHLSYSGGITALVTNGTTGPTVGTTITCNISADNTNFKQFAQVTAGLTGNTSYPVVFDLPEWVMYAQIVFNNADTTQGVTVEAQSQVLSTI